ncbi:hypothetical protein [Phocaeicola coprocola]|uniref:hypothetical protein n=1 Tax=Phocaeicola coprocola TaxID=310298 RepID=UPI0039946A88
MNGSPGSVSKTSSHPEGCIGRLELRSGIHQAFSRTTENLKGYPPWLWGWASQTEWHGVPEGIGLQIYQYEEHFVLNQRQHTGLPVVRYTLTHFAFQSEMAVIFIPMVLESY